MPIRAEQNPQATNLERHPLLARIAGETTWWLNTHVNMYEVQDGRNIHLMHDQLKKGSLIAYFNHRSGLDPGLILRFINDKVTDLHNVYFFTSQRRLDTERGPINNVQGFSLEASAKKCGFHLLPVVQKYEEDLYPNHAEINKNSSDIAEEALNATGKLVVIAPEGTRSKTGQLQTAERGVGALFRLGRRHTLAVPFGIIGTREHSPRVTLVVGNLIPYDSARKESLQRHMSMEEVLMNKLAVILPPDYHGVYLQSKKNT